MRYEVSRGGKVLYHGDLRYRPEIELCMLEAGYVLRLDGKRITAADVKKRAEERKEPRKCSR